MKRIVIMLLIVGSAITTTSADPTAAPKKPTQVINTLNAIIQRFGMSEGQVYSVNRNPNTGIMESSTKIIPFTCPINEIHNGNLLKAVSQNFQAEEPLSYQFQHIQPGSNENISLLVIGNDGKGKNVSIRSNNRQEMWLMCTKNPENPELRDAYAVAWELSENKQKAVGTVYMITSLRPDVYAKNQLKVEDIEDLPYSEDPREQLIVTDDIVEDTVLVDTIPGYNEPTTPRQSSSWEPTPEQMMQIEAKGMALKANMEALKATYKSLEPYYKMKSLTGTDPIFEQITKLNKQLDAKFQDYIKYLNGLDAGLDLPPTEKAEKAEVIGKLYKEVLKFYTEQNQGFTEMYKEVGVLTKAAQKTQKYINGLTEKYLKEMSKAVMGAE